MHRKPSMWRTLVAGLAGGAAFALGTFVTFAQFGGSGRGEQGLLFDPDTQSAKVGSAHLDTAEELKTRWTGG